MSIYKLTRGTSEEVFKARSAVDENLIGET